MGVHQRTDRLAALLGLGETAETGALYACHCLKPYFVATSNIYLCLLQQADEGTLRGLLAACMRTLLSRFVWD